MAVTFHVDTVHRLVRATFTRAVTLPELTAYARTLMRQRLLELPQLIDARRGTLALSAADTREFSDVMSSLRQVYGRAAVAFVSGDAASTAVGQAYREMGAGGSSAYEAFTDLVTAERWLTSQATDSRDPGTMQRADDGAPRGAGRVFEREKRMAQAEYDLLSRLEQGESVFRADGAGPVGHEAFAELVARLLALRSQGWIRLPDSRIMRDQAGRAIVAGPCDLTEAGRQALDQDRRLGPRP